MIDAIVASMGMISILPKNIKTIRHHLTPSDEDATAIPVLSPTLLSALIVSKPTSNGSLFGRRQIRTPTQSIVLPSIAQIE